MHDDNRSPSDPASRPSGSAGDDAPSFSPWQDASDGDLILYTRAGDGSAYGELWRRHARAGRTVARSFTSSLDPDDLVQESFAKIYQALQKGGGPTGAFRPYLFTTIRNTASAWGRARREASIDTLESFEDPASRDEETMAALDRSLTATAFRSLPTRWQEVLWYCEVEQMAPQQVAPLLAMKPNAVAALAYRAREGLRQAWIQAHIAAVPEGSEHRWTIERIGSYTRGSLGKRDTTKIEDHLDSCARCTIVAAEAKEVGSRIALVLLPLAAGTVGATGYLAWMQTGSHAALTTAAMPATVIGGHGLSLGSPVDPGVLSSLVGSSAGGAASGTAGSGAAGSGATGSASAAAGSSGAVSSGAVSTGVLTGGTVSAGAVTTGIVSGAIALVAAGAVAAALAFSPSTVVTHPGDSGDASGGNGYSASGTGPTSDHEDPTRGGGSTTGPSDETAPGPSPSKSPSPDPHPSAESEPSADPTAPSGGPTAPATPEKPAPTTPPDSDPDPDPDPETSRPGSVFVNMIEQGAGEALYPIVQGFAEDGATITIARGDEVLAELTSSEDGGWWLSEPLTSLPAGESEISIVQTVDGRTSDPVVQRITMREAPNPSNVRDGSIVFVTDRSFALDSAFPGAIVAGDVDGRSPFRCDYDDTGTTSTCSWNDDTWSALGFGFHTIRLAFTDGAGREGVPREIRVFVPLTGTTDASARAAGIGTEPAREAVDGADATGSSAPDSGADATDTDSTDTGATETDSTETDGPAPDAEGSDAEGSDAEGSDAPASDAQGSDAPASDLPADTGSDSGTPESVSSDEDAAAQPADGGTSAEDAASA